MMRRSAPRSQLDKLRSISLFSACSDRDLAQIDRLVDDIWFAKGDVLARQGTPARQAFVIVSGTASVSVDGTAIADVGPGDCVGEMALLARPVGVRSATVTATSDMNVLVLEARCFSALVDVPSVAKKLLGSLSVRLKNTDRAVAQA